MFTTSKTRLKKDAIPTIFKEQCGHKGYEGKFGFLLLFYNNSNTIMKIITIFFSSDVNVGSSTSSNTSRQIEEKENNPSLLNTTLLATEDNVLPSSPKRRCFGNYFSILIINYTTGSQALRPMGPFS